MVEGPGAAATDGRARPTPSAHGGDGTTMPRGLKGIGDLHPEATAAKPARNMGGGLGLGGPSEEEA